MAGRTAELGRASSLCCQSSKIEGNQVSMGFTRFTMFHRMGSKLEKTPCLPFPTVFAKALFHDAGLRRRSQPNLTVPGTIFQPSPFLFPFFLTLRAGKNRTRKTPTANPHPGMDRKAKQPEQHRSNHQNWSGIVLLRLPGLFHGFSLFFERPSRRNLRSWGPVPWPHRPT